MRVGTSALLSLLSASLASAKLSWNSTDFMFVFGDSYSTTAYNVSAGVNSPTPGYVSSNGPNWVQALTSRYNITDTKVFNLAYGGATIDSKLVEPYLPTVQSIVTQVGLFEKYLAPKPTGAHWNSSNSLFAFWIGINDVGNSFYWTNVSQPAFHAQLMTRLFGQVETLYQSGARSFLFLTVPPTNRAPLMVEQGSYAVNSIASALADYNSQLNSSVANFRKKHKDLDQVIVFDTQPIFNTLLDNADIFGFVNSTGYSEAYENGTPTQTYQAPGYAPVSSYFWLNSLHPLFTVHDILAKAISTTLSGW